MIPLLYNVFGHTFGFDVSESQMMTNYVNWYVQRCFPVQPKRPFISTLVYNGCGYLQFWIKLCPLY